MKRNLWVALSCLLVLTIALAGCQTQAPTTTTPGEQKVTGETKTPAAPAPQQPVVKPPEKQVPAAATDVPKRGGTLTIGGAADILGFDEGFTPHYLTVTLKQTNEELWQGDWTRGPAGTNEFSWQAGGVNRVNGKAPSLATSWELPDNSTMIFHIRQGVRFQTKQGSPASGRELTSDDVLFSLERYRTLATSYFKLAYGAMSAATTITAPDKWTILIKVDPKYFGDAISLYPDYAAITPRDAVEKLGDLRDWRNAIGTGPFLLTDFISNSSATMVKNPNYWDKDPIGPGKGGQLPYIDGIKYLIIPDLSTRYTALRTGKIDWVVGVSWDDAASIRKTNTELQYIRYLPDSAYVVFMRTDKKELPFANVKVRQAMELALDKDRIQKDHYGGEAVLLAWPVTPSKEYANAFAPLETLPADTRELYEKYDVEKAKKLLTEAGYPNGFKAKLVCYNTPSQVDLMSLLKSMWAKAGIEVEIEAKEYAVWTSLMAGRSYDEMLYGYVSGNGTYYKMININGTSQYNGSRIDDPKIVEARAKMDTLLMNEPEMEKFNKELMPYVLSQAYVIQPPWAYTYFFWQPWLKNFHGEYVVGYYNWNSFSKYIWIDQELKAKSGK